MRIVFGDFVVVHNTLRNMRTHEPVMMLSIVRRMIDILRAFLHQWRGMTRILFVYFGSGVWLLHVVESVLSFICSVAETSRGPTVMRVSCI